MPTVQFFRYPFDIVAMERLVTIQCHQVKLWIVEAPSKRGMFVVTVPFDNASARIP